jgi:hypothetical protein
MRHEPQRKKLKVAEWQIVRRLMFGGDYAQAKKQNEK